MNWSRLRWILLAAAPGVAAGLGFWWGVAEVRAHGYVAAGLGHEALDAFLAAARPALIAASLLSAIDLAAASWRGSARIGRVSLLAFAILGPWAALEAAATSRPTPTPGARNLILISIDTLRADHLGAYGYPRDTSPRIDAWAAGALRFDQAIVQWPKTTPSMTSMLTGTYPHANGVTRLTPQQIGREPTMLAEILRNHGWTTRAVSAHAALSKTYGFDQGFDEFVEAWRGTGSKSERSAAAMEGWLREADDAPFFLWAHFTDPHARYHPPEPHHRRFVDDAFDVDDRIVPFNDSRDNAFGGIPGRSRLGDEGRAGYYVAEYDAEIRYVDELVGRIFDALEASGRRDDTIVVLTADHGESLGEHDYWFEHGATPYEDCLRVPLMIALPGAASGVEAAPVELTSLVPTLLELLELPAPPTVRGHSLAPRVRGHETPLPELVFAGASHRHAYQRILRQGPWKLIYVPNPRDRAVLDGALFELYDLAADPAETTNLAEREPERLAEMRRALEAWMARTERVGAWTRPHAAEPDAAAVDQLRALGYLQ